MTEQPRGRTYDNPPKELLILGYEPANMIGGGALQPGTAEVYVARDGSVIGPEGRPTSFRERTTIKHRYLVDVGRKQTKVRFQLPARGDLYGFDAEADVSWQVDRPWILVAQKLNDGYDVLVSRLEFLMRSITEDFAPEQRKQAERALNTRFGERAGHMPEGIAVWRCMVKLRHDEARAQVIKAAQTNDVQQVQADGILALKQGDPSMIAMYLAQNKGDIKSVIDMVAKEREVDIQTKFQLLEILKNQGGLLDVDVAQIRTQLLGNLTALSAGDVPPAVGSGQQAPRPSEDDGPAW